MKADWDLVIIRHARSTFNDAEVDYMEDHPQLTYPECDNDPGYKKNVLYSHKHIDAVLSKAGQEQCPQLRQQVKNLGVDLVLVSPMRRAIMTALNAFQGKVEMKVEPQLAEAFRYTCDLAVPLKQLMVQFPMVDLSSLSKQPPHWYMKKLEPHHRSRLQQWQKLHPGATYEQQQSAILEMMDKGLIYETDKEMRQRALRILPIVYKYRQTHKKIAIVAHFYTINSLITPHSHDLDSNYVYNAEPHYTTFAELHANSLK